MSDIPPISTGTTSTTATGQSLQADIGEEFNSFIQLLTAQVQNQDPLSPLDSTQFVEQLATFSALEQQVQSNESLQQIAALVGDLNALAASQWLGEQVTVQSSWVPFSGEPVEFEVDKPQTANRAVLTVRDTNGDVAWSETLDIADDRYVWNGQLSSGGTAPNDSIYQVSVDFYSNNDFAGSAAPRLVTTVTDVATENGKLRLGTAMKLSADAETVRRVE